MQSRQPIRRLQKSWWKRCSVSLLGRSLKSERQGCGVFDVLSCSETHQAGVGKSVCSALREAAQVAVVRALIFLIPTLVVCSSARAQRNRFATEDSRSQYVHWIELRDADGNVIDPTAEHAPPYSPKHTCGKCHDYDLIAKGHHFAGLLEQEGGRKGEPLIWTDLRTGTQLPLSFHHWPGTYTPQDVGLTNWDLLLKFGAHLPGGALGQPPQTPAKASEDSASTKTNTTQKTTPSGRWKLSGPLEIDCLICHARPGSGYSPELRAKELEKQNFAWAATAASGLADVKGSVKLLPDSFDPTKQKDTKQSGPHLPQTKYRAGLFVETKVFVDIVRKPDNSACYYCHTARLVGPGTKPEWLKDQDVHVGAGLACADCHRNGLAHQTVRGYEGEKHPSGDETIDTFTCRGCHFGANDSLKLAGGHFAAPRPEHKGLPPLHFEKLTCTACHSGPLPSRSPVLVQTSHSHNLGKPSHRHADDLPQVVEPVFLKNAQGKIAPYRLVWPAFWGVLKDGKITPLNPDTVYKEVRRALRVRRDIRKELVRVRLSPKEKEQLLGKERASLLEFQLSEQERLKLEKVLNEKRAEGVPAKLVKALKELAKKHPNTTPVYICGGKAYRLSKDGKSVEEFDTPAAEPYAWPLAHDVRPAAQALGAGGCTDCHSNGSPIFYGTVTALGPLPDKHPKQTQMYKLQGLNPQLLALWNRSFKVRPYFKIFTAVSVCLTLLVLLVALMLGLSGLLQLLFGSKTQTNKEKS